MASLLLKPHVPAFTVPQLSEAMDVLQEKARDLTVFLNLSSILVYMLRVSSPTHLRIMWLFMYFMIVFCWDLIPNLSSVSFMLLVSHNMTYFQHGCPFYLKNLKALFFWIISFCMHGSFLRLLWLATGPLGSCCSSRSSKFKRGRTKLVWWSPAY